MITLCAVLCGFEDWVSIEDFGAEHEAWLRTFLELPHGIPSHDTLSVVIGRIDKAAFAQSFAAWVSEALPSLAGHQVALDGKTLRGSASEGHGAAHLMSAFATQARLVLGVQTVADKSNEITVIPQLLAQLELAGAIVTLDAMGCQKSVAQDIVQRKADYVLALKDNHPTLHEDVRLWLEDCDTQGHVRQVQAVEKNHGRLERRRVAVSTELGWLAERERWLGLQAVAMVESTRQIRGKTSLERRYYLSSIADPQRIATAIREHWVLDVQFGEDGHRARKNHSAANLGIIRRACVNLIRANDPSSLSVRRRKNRASYNQAYREKLLFGESRRT
jgi:predicted transposase YbfD/YdcC